MAQRALTWDDFPDAPAAPPTVQRRKTEADIVQSGASTESAEAAAARSRTLTPIDARKALAEAVALETKAAAEAGAVSKAKDAKAFNLTESTDLALSHLAKARALISGHSAEWGSLLKGVPGTDARALNSLIGKDSALLSNIMLDAMQALKAASPTGATGFGQQSNAEGAALRNSLGNLDLGLEPEQLLDVVNEIERHYRRYAAFTRGENPDEKDTAVRYGLITPDEAEGPDKGAMAAARPVDPTGATRSEGVGALKGLNSVVDSMLKQGRTSDQIRAYIDTIAPGLGDKAIGLEQAEAYYKQPAAQRKKQGAPVVNLESVDKENGWLGQLIGKAAASPAGAAVIGSTDTLTSGLLDDAVGALGGNADAFKMNMKAAELANPNAYFAGQMVGGVEQALVPGALGMGGLATKYGLGAGKLGALQGGAYGWGSSDESGLAALPDAALGAGLGAVGGKVGDAVGRGIGRTVRGIADTVPTSSSGYRPNPARYLNEQGVPMTIGEMLGGGVRSVENFVGKLPFTKNMVGNRLDEGIVGYNQAAARQSLEGLEAKYQPTTGAISDTGVQEARAIASQAFDDVLKPLRLKPDADYASSVKLALAELEDVDPRAFKAIAAPLKNFLNDTTNGGKHTITGKELQAALRTVQEASGSFARASDPLYPAMKPHFDTLDDAFRGLVERQVPDALPKYDAAREAYRRVSILEGATKKADANPGQIGDVPDANRAFTPNELEASGQLNATAYTGRNSGVGKGYPLEPLARAGQDVLTQRTKAPSGLSALYGVGLPSTIAGAGYFMQPGGTRDPQTGETTEGRDWTLPVLAGLGTTAALALPYSKGSSAGLQKWFMGAGSGRQDLGDMLLKYAPSALRGAGADAPTAINFSGLPEALPTPNDTSAMLPAPLEQAAPAQQPEAEGHVVEIGGQRILLPPGAMYDPVKDEIVGTDGTRIKRSALTP